MSNDLVERVIRECWEMFRERQAPPSDEAELMFAPTMPRRLDFKLGLSDCRSVKESAKLSQEWLVHRLFWLAMETLWPARLGQKDATWRLLTFLNFKETFKHEWHFVIQHQHMNVANLSKHSIDSRGMSGMSMWKARASAVDQHEAVRAWLRDKRRDTIIDIPQHREHESLDQEESEFSLCDTEIDSVASTDLDLPSEDDRESEIQKSCKRTSGSVEPFVQDHNAERSVKRRRLIKEELDQKRSWPVHLYSNAEHAEKVAEVARRPLPYKYVRQNAQESFPM